MDLVDDVVGEVVNAGFDLVQENIGGMFTNMTLLNMLLLSLLTDKPFPKTAKSFNKTYDYVIVGGGTAGSVMANRLSQKPCVSVLLLEAGGYAPILSEIPAYARVFYGSDIDWFYKTTPQEHGAYGQKENRVIWNSGKALGGSSVLNAMLYVRGNKKNYDDWAAEGATGWSYEEVFPFFMKLENTSRISERYLDSGYHGKDGPMTMEMPKYVPEIKPPILEAISNLGYEVRDINGERQTGIYTVQGTLRNGQRCSTAKAYLVPAENRPNLTILKNAFATKILINKKKKAYGVEFDFEGKGNTKRVKARKEVIISVGAVRTPQILMLSGIGPKDELEKHKIPIVAELPVGKNLQDHYATNLNYLLPLSIMNIVLKCINPVNILSYLTTRTGVLTCPNEVTVIAFLDGLKTNSTSPDFPRQELYFAESATVDAFKNYNIKDEAYLQVYGKYVTRSQYTCIVSLLQPESRGEILLSSTDPYDHPLINPKYYEKESDLRDMVEGMKVCHAVGTSPAMKALGAEPFDTVFPGCEKHDKYTDEFFSCHAKSMINTFWHPAGTARMGQPDDPRSVVDPQLKVIGVRHLRVVNAAVMPIVPSGNTNVPTMMVAERVYDMMKDDMNCN